MTTVLILRHVAHESAGSLEACLVAARAECRYVDLFREIPRQLPLEEAGALVVLGGPMSVHDSGEYPFLAVEIPWIQEAVERQLPVLGICLGSQLLAKAMGANVYPNQVKEIGWYGLDALPAAGDDSLFAGCAPTETVFQWHGDTFDLPHGATWLAQSALCKHQAFRVGPCAWGLQFHIEMTPDMVDDWLAEPGNCRELAELDYIDPAAIRVAAPREFIKMDQFGRRVLSRFAALCVRQRQSRAPLGHGGQR
jgi:GMP synthase (glutamine-hydrolysing)